MERTRILGECAHSGADDRLVRDESYETDLEGMHSSGSDSEASASASPRSAGRRIAVRTLGSAALLLGVVALGAASWNAIEQMAPASSRRSSNQAASSKELVGLAAARAGFCNPLTPIPQAVTPRVFDMPAELQPICTPSQVPWPRWQRRNLCWGWVKLYGCASAQGHVTWVEAQNRTAKIGRVPKINETTFPGLSHPELCDRADAGAPLQPTKVELEEAYQWLLANVDIYVMNLDTDTERLARFSSGMSGLGLPFQRIKGVDMRIAGALEQAVADGIVPSDYNLTYAREKAANETQAMGIVTGTIGIAAAHLNGMKHVKANSSKPLAIVFEDDVTPHDDFAAKLKQLVLQEAPCDWQVISLKSRCPYGRCVTKHLTRVEPDGNEPADRCRHGVNYGFFGMLYKRETIGTVRETLSRAVWDEERPHCLDIDVALAASSDHIAYYAVPAVQHPGLIHEGGMGSSRTRGNWYSIGQGLKEGEH